MLQITPQMRILVAIEAVDGRKGIDSLVQLCRETLDADPSPAVYLCFAAGAQLPSDCWLMTARGSGSPKSGFRKDVSVVAKRRRPARSLEAYQAQLLLAAGDPIPKPRRCGASELNGLTKKGLAFPEVFCHTAAVAAPWRYRGRNIGEEEIAFLRQFIAEHPTLSRWALSRQLCEVWQWKQANGTLVMRSAADCCCCWSGVARLSCRQYGDIFRSARAAPRAVSARQSARARPVS